MLEFNNKAKQKNGTGDKYKFLHIREEKIH